MKKRTIIILLILALSIYTSNINTQSAAEENNYRPTLIELTPHESIEITSDGNFADYSFPGTGTEVDPYVIEGYNITTTSNIGIYISNTTKYFTVRNCYVDASDNGIYIDDVADGTATIANNTCSNNNYYGIRFDGSVSSTVTNNTCSNNNWYGIWLPSSCNSTVANNTCNNNGYGIYLESSSNSTIANNTCNNNIDYSIWLSSSGNSTIANNTCNNNGNGIWLLDSDFCVITNNLLQENEGYGVYLFDSDNNTIHHNNFEDNLGVTSQAYDDGANNTWYDTTTLEGNYWSDWTGGSYSIDGPAGAIDLYPLGEPVIDLIYITSDANFTDYSFPGTGTEVDPYVIEGYNITTTNDIGIYIYDTTKYFIVRNCYVDANDFGIYIGYVADGTAIIINNTCNNNNHYGIVLGASGSSTVANNTCKNNLIGIGLSSSGSSTILNNSCNNNDIGIYLFDSDFCVITCNLLQENEEHGACLLSDSDNNLIHHNTFIDNNLGGTSQACDACTNNFWYDTATLEGNYWSDWSGTGNYSIDGYAGAIDLYPLGPPVITNVTHYPSPPTELDAVTINATVTSPYGVQSVMLHYRVNGGVWIEVSMIYISGDLYSVTLGSFAVSDIIEYYVSAVDNSVNHNEAINDNSSLYYSFTVVEVIPEFQIFSSLLPVITFLFLVVGLIVLQRRKK